MAAIKNIINGSLKSKIIELIRLRGPLTVADYIKIVLTNPESGFYMNKDVFGVKGHFTTSPEISQVFGEVLGVWIYQEWKRFNFPKPLRLVEFGPGRGTLMSDISRTLKTLKQDFQINMIEISQHMKEMQYKTLGQLSKITQWHTRLGELDESQDGFNAYIAHEFLDALPIHKFVRDPKTNSWKELLVDYDQHKNLRFCISRHPSLSTRLLIPESITGSHFEVCPEAALLLEKVATRLNRAGKGCMLVCDYGFEENLTNRDSFRAFKSHKSWPPLMEPGEADLTADVDFAYIKRHLTDKSLLFGSTTQKNFLLKCGFQARLNVLIEKNKNNSEDLISGANMLIDDMGSRYRFLAMFPKETGSLFDGDPPAGFEAS